MPNPHLSIKVISRSSGQSAVAAAAYQSGEKLFSAYDQTYKHYAEKRGIVHAEILLPSNAPPEYADRAALWNAVEKAEKQWNAQLARRLELALPVEVPPEQYPDLIRGYCWEFFVNKGMCADFAIHDPDPPGHNPHAHVLLTMRAMDDRGAWLPKARKVYDLDENGKRIRLPSGQWKSHKENTVDWNERSNTERWRQGWADWQNRYLAQNQRPERVDLRSYARQHLEQIPTVHEGPAVTAMERRGIQTDVGNLNREIRRLNRIMQSIRRFIWDLKAGLQELRQAEQQMKAQKASEKQSQLPVLLMNYTSIRKRERLSWTPYGRQKGAVEDLKKVTQAMNYLNQLGLRTVDDLEAHIEQASRKAKEMNADLIKKQNRIHEIDRILVSLDTVQKLRPFYQKYASIHWKRTKEQYKQEHPEVARFFQARAFLRKRFGETDPDLDALHAERKALTAELMDAAEPLKLLKKDLKQLHDIRYWVRKATPGTKENLEAPPKQSVLEQLKEPSSSQQNKTEPSGVKQKPER